MTVLIVLALLVGAGVAFWMAVRGRTVRRPRRWLVSKTKYGKVYADRIKYPPVGWLQTHHDDARRERAELIGDQPSLFNEIEWWLVPDAYCTDFGPIGDPDLRFPVPWRDGVIFTRGWTIRSQHKTALSRTGLLNPYTIKVETWNNYGAFREDDPL